MDHVLTAEQAAGATWSRSVRPCRPAVPARWDQPGGSRALRGERKKAGTPAAGHQVFRKMIENIGAARPPTWRVAAHIGCGPPVRHRATVAKPYTSEAAVRCGNNALHISGGWGRTDEYPVGELPPTPARCPSTRYQSGPEVAHRSRLHRCRRHRSS
ncbi:acyl-CoA dehydrogenase family protein [Streptomyces sp. 8N706]|uniref:acyl-CoA dehydrogenase family protein n=1 Tax=Streptomyces sp. 8N706 TaxID=3457416 RepID=UPI003FD6561B